MLAAAVGVILAAQDGHVNRDDRRQSLRSIVLALVAAAISLGSGWPHSITPQAPGPSRQSFALALSRFRSC